MLFNKTEGPWSMCSWRQGRGLSSSLVLCLLNEPLPSLTFPCGLHSFPFSYSSLPQQGKGKKFTSEQVCSHSLCLLVPQKPSNLALNLVQGMNEHNPLLQWYVSAFTFLCFHLSRTERHIVRSFKRDTMGVPKLQVLTNDVS